jgi:hypothetical protein
VEDRHRKDKGSPMTRNQELHKNFPKRLIQSICIMITLAYCCTGRSQGVFLFFNPDRPTLLANGQAAGPGIWGQALVGLTNSSLTPVGFPAEHQANGIILSQTIEVPFSFFYTYVQVQMAVWDGTIWGTDFASVPPSQLGFTDIVPVLLVQPLDPNYNVPFFTRSAVVPVVPEPSAGIFTLVAMLALRWKTVIARLGASPWLKTKENE